MPLFPPPVAPLLFLQLTLQTSGFCPFSRLPRLFYSSFVDLLLSCVFSSLVLSPILSILCISFALFMSLCTLRRPGAGGGRADKCQSDTRSRHERSDPVNTPVLLSARMYVDHTHALCIYSVCYSWERYSMSTAFELFTQRQLCLARHTKGAIPDDFIQSCLGNLHPFSQPLFFFLLVFFSLWA